MKACADRAPPAAAERRAERRNARRHLHSSNAPNAEHRTPNANGPPGTDPREYDAPPIEPEPLCLGAPAERRL